ncbi:hypothetical protein [Sediminibacterium sp.]|uniref:hypothetical protein n=1 Tax=Sediminibacterium sp. TaxID=1917865 RepID=UPI0025DD31C4|nr:hypothetical protein [Sediminibacterium sp.]MBT9484243.1 hypothetical protein [Sediminibacterium sp.]
MKNLNLGKQLSRDEQKQIQGGGWILTCPGKFMGVTTMLECMAYGALYCGGFYKCTNTGDVEV